MEKGKLIKSFVFVFTVFVILIMILYPKIKQGQATEAAMLATVGALSSAVDNGEIEGYEVGTFIWTSDIKFDDMEYNVIGNFKVKTRTSSGELEELYLQRIYFMEKKKVDGVNTWANRLELSDGSVFVRYSM